LGDPDLDDAGVAELRQVITATGAVDRVEELIGDLLTEAVAALHSAPIGPEALDVLEQLALAATDRRG
jgi:geranylgeranyl diphosphate synthase type I